MKLSARHRQRTFDWAQACTGQLMVGEPVRDYRKELWIAVAAGVASTENCIDRTSPQAYADAALAAFDSTFGS
jgi:hypothetical protein